MSIDARDLSPEQRRELGITLVGGHARRKLLPARAGYTSLTLGIAPPSATHHAKKIQRRGARMTLVNSPALKAATDRYLLAIEDRRDLVPLAGPIALHVSFRFKADKLPATGWGGYHGDKPDTDNQIKLLTDVLALRGFWADDCQVAKLVVEKRWTLEGGAPCVWIYARTLLGPADDGRIVHPHPSDKPGQIYPLPPLAGGPQ